MGMGFLAGFLASLAVFGFRLQLALFGFGYLAHKLYLALLGSGFTWLLGSLGSLCLLYLALGLLAHKAHLADLAYQLELSNSLTSNS